MGQVQQVGQEQVQTDYLQAVLYLTCQSFWLTSGRVTLQVHSLHATVTGIIAHTFCLFYPSFFLFLLFSTILSLVLARLQTLLTTALPF